MPQRTTHPRLLAGQPPCGMVACPFGWYCIVYLDVFPPKTARPSGTIVFAYGWCCW